MPRRDDISSILLIGSGPIVIGQACEFDYSGTQACRVLREEGYRVILANSNPATIMTDPDFADATYVEPLDVEILTRIIERERPDALLPTLGGQTALNLAMDLVEAGVLDRYGVELIGADAEAIATAEDRERFKVAMIGIGLDVPASGVAAPPAELKRAPKGQQVAAAMESARRVVAEIGLPVVIRPAYILGGKGTGIASTTEEFERVASHGLDASPITEILIEKSIAGWKEYELEVMRDRADNCVIICSIENVDPMGVHTGDSITVAPAQTLSDVEYQRMRDAAFACIRRVGVETGGSNVQFALNPLNGDMVVIEMNPRVSRSSALASKATGFPIAKIAARLAVGYTLDEIPNDITRKTPASFEPTIDYVVTKVPRWAFEKFPGQAPVLGTQMQSVGEAMAIGRTFPESLQKALRSLEQGRLGLNADPTETVYDDLSDQELVAAAALATPDRMFQLEAAIRRGISLEKIHEETKVDPWFLDQMAQITDERAVLEELGVADMDRRAWRRAKRLGFGDAQLAHLWNVTEDEVRAARIAAGVVATFKTVDTCGAEFEAETPYHYSTYEDDDEVRPGDRSQPHRPGDRVRLLLRPRQLRSARSRLRDDHAQLQPRDGLHRLRHVGPPLLRAAHLRRRDERDRGGAGRRSRGTEGRDRFAQWSDPTQAVGPPARRTGPGNLGGIDRSGRGPRRVERPLCPSRHPPTSRWYRCHRRGGPGHRRRGRLPGARTSVLRAGRSGHGDRLRRRPT